MADRVAPNLPSRDFASVSRFYRQFGFTETRHEPSGGIVGAVIDPDGILIPLIQAED